MISFKYYNVKYLINNINEVRYSFIGRLVIICSLIAGLIVALLGIIIFLGLHFISNGTSYWMVSVALFTQNLLATTSISIFELATLLVVVGGITFLSMSILLPRSQNIPPQERIIL